MTDLPTRIAEVRKAIDEAAARSAETRDIALVAVSKRKPAADIAEAHAAGCLDFGENYVQELRDKAAELGHLEARWHFIGHLQRNKVKHLLEAGPSLIHGVDSARLLREIDKRASTVVDVLLQVNVADEASKSGCAPAETPELVDVASDLEHVRVRGLMTIPPAGDAESSRGHFRRLRDLAEEIGRERLPELSMGMSHDFPIAVEEGATIVRVGTAIFGPRA